MYPSLAHQLLADHLDRLSAELRAGTGEHRPPTARRPARRISLGARGRDRSSR